ncbi:carbon storage regulator CsrA [Peribacillus acanthi]|uniref:carbon storage regulator CsrA n=1 Tax=Peribacillus acanthi TaxID=2171554 RepID=UPI000D3E7948|nr:carbon storage regulator CsrA [Peribacillus acanthi]
MLVLTRKKGESIQIGEGVEVKIVSIQGEQVKIGIEAPDHLEIYRKEIWEKILQENQEALGKKQDLVDLLKKQK